MGRNININIVLKILFLILVFALASCAHLGNAQSLGASKGANSLVVKVCEGIYRGPRLGDLNELKSIKVRTILNLEDDTEAVGNEEAAAEELGIKVIKMPMSGIVRPNSADLIKAAEIMEDPKLQPVYVHCRHGRDRTGFAIAAYRILHDGWTMDRAYREAIDDGHAWWLYDVFLRWKKSLRELSGKSAIKKAPAQPLSTSFPAAS